ncbi:hypothetical protein MKMG_00453 [Methanogenium sp. MK-MG]|nr:hypothetical protein MKMG_00453 [Methanogenium sp. MK-MG]
MTNIRTGEPQGINGCGQNNPSLRIKKFKGFVQDSREKNRENVGHSVVDR